MAERPKDEFTRWRDRKLVAVVLHADRCLRAEADARGWRLVNLLHSELPKGLVPQGALVEELPDSKRVKMLSELGCPVVRVGRFPHPDDHMVPAVLLDYAAAGRLAAEHFCERGFRDVGYMGSEPWSDSAPLFEGFVAHAESLGMACHLYRFRGRQYRRNVARKRREFQNWLKAAPKPLGLFAPGDVVAVAYCAWASGLGLAVPEEVAVLSCGNQLDVCESSMPTISSIDMDGEVRLHEACDLLAGLMAGGHPPPKPIMIAPRAVVERESSNVLATSDRVVAAALRYMWDHLDTDLSVESVAREVGMSRRQLVRRFQKAIGRSIIMELRRKRLAQVKFLLSSTDLPIAELAPLAGFHSTAYLQRVFREDAGMTPTQFRRQFR